MAKTKDILEAHGKRRREFVKKSATVAATAPAVALLLAQSSKPAHAVIYNQYTVEVTPEIDF